MIHATRLELEEPGFPLRVETVPGIDPESPRAPRTLSDALGELPQVMVQKTSYGQGSPFVRGFTGFRTLTLVDGIRLNNAVYRDGPNPYTQLVDPLLLDSARVLLGPTAIAHGSDAVGGTIDLRTRTPALSAAGVEYGGRIYQRYSSAEQSSVTRFEGETRSPWIAVAVGGSLKHFGDLSAGRHQGELENTGYDEWSGDAKVVARLGETLDGILAYQRHVQDEVPRTHSTILSRSYRGTTIGSDTQRDLDLMRELVYGRLVWFPEPDFEAELTIYRYLLSEEEDRIRSNGRHRFQGFEDESLGIMLRVTGDSPVGRLRGGADYVREGVDSFFREFNPDGSLRVKRPRGPVADQSTYEQVGVFLEDTVSVLDGVEVTFGGRFTFVQVDADEVDPDPTDADVIPSIHDHYSSFVGGARVRYRPASQLELFAGATQSFRAPNLSDLTRFDAARSGEAEIPAPGLDPEEFLTLEVGAHVRAGGVNATLSYYHTFIDNMIVRFPTGAVDADGDVIVTKDNVGDGFVHGVELTATVDLPRDLTLYGGFSWLEGRADTFVAPGVKSEEALSRMQPATAIIGVRYRPAAHPVRLEADVRVVDDQGRLSPRDQADTQRIPPGGSPGYTVIGVRGSWEPRSGLELFAGVENLTDRDYRVHGSGSNEPGVNFVAGFDWRF